MKALTYVPIGVIHSPFPDATGTPLQPAGAAGTPGTVKVDPEYCSGLKDVEEFSHIILIYHFHLAEGYTLHVEPFMDDTPHGVFATRAPKRPNSIGISVVRLVKVEGCTLYIEDVDVVDGTPLLDIKPYVPDFDVRETDGIGWLSTRVQKVYVAKADERFR